MDTAARNTTNDVGVFVNLATTTDFGPQINVTIWFLTALSASFLALRVYCKFLRHRGLWWDDYLLILSWLALVADCAFVSVCINMGFGRSMSLFNPDNLDVFLLHSNLAGSFSILAALWSKTSFAVTVLRISNGWVKVLVWFIIVTVNVCLGVAIAITWGQCTPIDKIWRPSLPGECWPKEIQVHYNMFTAIYSGAMDIVLAILPWKIIWTLTMNKSEKAGVLVAMSMGIFAGITSIIKITQLPAISNATFTDSTTQLVILGAAEAAITVIAASIPILRALLRERRLPPGPAGFYHSPPVGATGDNESGGGGRRMYMRTIAERGQNVGGNMNSVVVMNGAGNGYRRSGSRNGSLWSKQEDDGRASWLSRFSRLSVFALGSESTVGGTRETERRRGESETSLA